MNRLPIIIFLLISANLNILLLILEKDWGMFGLLEFKIRSDELTIQNFIQ